MLEWIQGIGSLQALFGVIGMMYVKLIRKPMPNDPVGALTMILSFALAVAGFTVMLVPAVYFLFN